MESLAEELDTTVIELLSLEDATNKEVVKEVTQISVFEKENVLQELRIRSYLKIVIAIIVFVALIQVSKILNDHGIYGRGQMLTMGLLALWGTWCYFTSESWINAEFCDLLCGYITPFAGCIIGWLLMYRKK